MESVLRQQSVDFELIVVDEASDDETVKMVRAWGDSRVRLIGHTSPWGVAASRNDGASHASGDWIAFLDDDDVWAPDKLRRQIAAANNSERGWSYVGSVNVDENLRVVSGTPALSPELVVDLVSRYNVVPGGGSNVIIKRDLLEAAGPFDTRLKNTEDWEMWIRLAELGMPAAVAAPLMARRIHPGNASLDIDAIMAGILVIEDRHRIRLDRGVLHRWLAESSFRTGQRRQAARHLLLAAAQGQIRGVWADATSLAWRRVMRVFARSRVAPPPAGEDDWISLANTWLADLRSFASEVERSMGPTF
jgi:glycosyltransferase involved in cell wall biosynthesis